MAAVAHIALTRGKTAIVSAVDACLGELRSYHARPHRTGSWYAYTSVRLPSRKNKQVALHTIVVGVVPKGMQVDHINGDALDNRRENLRVVDGSVNNRNRVGAQKNSTTGHLGVYKMGNGYACNICHNGKQNYLGYFSTIEQAIQARKDAEIRLWGIQPRREAYLKGTG